jgi:hypothetical protein
MILRRHLPPSGMRQLLRDAGPPNSWAIAALIGGAPVLGLAAAATGSVRILLVISWLGILTLPSILDRDGWRIRIGMAWLATEQHRRQQGLRGMPRTPAGADRWLERPDAGESALMRASALTIAGKTAEARGLVENHSISDPEDRARVARMLAALDGLERGRVDPAAANSAIDDLPPDARRYQRVSLGWSTAWVESSNGRPWRRAFADVCRGIPTMGIARRALAYAAFQELLPPIVGLILLVLFRVFGWL